MIAYDLETFPFGPSNLAPKPICLTWNDGGSRHGLVGAHEDAFIPTLEMIFEDDLIFTANGAYDAAVLLQHVPSMRAKIWDAYRKDRVTDIQIREQLRVLADTGNLEYAFLPNGAKTPLSYSQGELEKRLLGIDRTELKNSTDSWRTNYEVLAGVDGDEYPAEAWSYAYDDSKHCYAIGALQEKDSSVMGAQFLNSRASLALYLSSCWGFAVDKERVEDLFAKLSERFDEKNFTRLISMGILRPSQPERPYANASKRITAAIGDKPWEGHVEELKALGIKFKAAEPASVDQELLRGLVETICKAHDIVPKLTDTGKVSFAEEAQADIKGLDPTFDEYIDRVEIAKLVTTELPRMRGGRVHPRYRTLVKTSRTSSYGNSKKDKDPAYPSTNIQQVDPRVREAYVPAPGYVLCSIDYNYIELVSAAQKCLTLFDQSVLADKINAGYDPHAYLGSRLTRRLDSTYRGPQDPEENYHVFKALKESDSKRYKHWRNLAKPTGLGFLGGLGAKTFVAYAKSNFNIDLVAIAGSMEAAIELAKELKQEWLDTYPEFAAYFQWVNRECRDIEWSTPDDQRYLYVSPHGTIRRNCYYTEATNGACLQTATAEGAKIALWKLAEAMHDATLGSCLLGLHQPAFVHDEVILELPFDDYTHERAYEAAKLWIAGMSEVMTRVKVSAEPALMFRWNKAAEPVFDSKNRLIPWQPKKAS